MYDKDNYAYFVMCINPDAEYKVIGKLYGTLVEAINDYSTMELSLFIGGRKIIDPSMGIRWDNVESTESDVMYTYSPLYTSLVHLDLIHVEYDKGLMRFNNEAISQFCKDLFENQYVGFFFQSEKYESIVQVALNENLFKEVL